MTPANDNCRNMSAITRGGRVLYVLGFDERACIIGEDKVLITHPDRPARLISAIDGEFLGEIRA